MEHFIYADNAATTPLDAEAFDAMKPFLLDEFGNASQPYSFARAAKKALRQSRAVIAECIGARPEEIFFTSGGTESDNWAVKGCAFADSGRGAVVASAVEHHAVLRSCEALARLGWPVTFLPVDSAGMVQPDAFAACLPEGARLASVMLGNNEIGSIQPVKALAQAAHERGALFHTDAVQAVGHVKIDVNDLGVDLLSASAHKFNGPKGIGFLYVRAGTPVASYASGGAQESGMRAGTENVASIVGMAAALKKSCALMECSAEHLLGLERLLIGGLRDAGVDFIQNGGAHRLPGIISLSFRGRDGEVLLHRLDLSGICVSTGSACDSRNTQISHVLKAIGLPPESARGTIRVSLSRSNTEAEVRRIAETLIRICG